MPNINEFVFILTIFCGDQPLSTSPRSLPHIIFVVSPREEIKMNNCVVFCLVHKMKKGKTRVGKGGKKRNQAARGNKEEEKRQRILISDYIDRIISQLYPLFLSVPFFVSVLVVILLIILIAEMLVMHIKNTF